MGTLVLAEEGIQFKRKSGMLDQAMLPFLAKYPPFCSQKVSALLKLPYFVAP